MSGLSFLFGATAEDLVSKLSWESIEATMTTPRNRCASTVVKNELFVFGGSNDTDGCLSSIEVYNIDDDRWRTLPELPIARKGSVAVTVDNKILLIGGYNRYFFDLMEILELQTHTWSPLPSMKNKRAGCCAGVSGNFLIVAGGSDERSERLSSAELFDLNSHQWLDIPEMNYPHTYGAMTVIGTKAYIFGGLGQKTAEVFDFETCQWKILPSMSKIREGCVAITISNFILVIGNASNVVEVFDVESQTWSTIENVPSARQYCCGGLVGNQVLVAGGRDSDNNQLNTAVSLNLKELLPAPCLPKLPNIWRLNRRVRKETLEKWIGQVTSMKLEYGFAIETATVCVSKEYMERKKKLKSTVEDSVEEEKALDVWNKERQEKLSQMADRLEDQVKVARDQIGMLELRLGETEPNGRGNDRQEQRNKEGLLSLIYCPISGNRMVDPVMAADGYTYERSAIVSKFDETPSDGEVLSPVTGEALAHRELVENVAIWETTSEYE
mmetsp:Transcript_2170/g.5095  ORF Transcript_2170/g.5095 Transcript_2170/m.5095 type:complete len:498 (-) Transcript_2170:133-1626(-)